MRPALYRPLRASLPRAARHAVASTSARKAGPSFSTTASVEGAAIESSISANPARRVEFATSLRKRASRIAEMIHSRTLLMKRHHKKSLHPSSIPEFTRLLPRSVRRKMDKDAYLEEIDRRYKEQKLALRTHFPHMVDKCTSRAMVSSLALSSTTQMRTKGRNNIDQAVHVFSLPLLGSSTDLNHLLTPPPPYPPPFPDGCHEHRKSPCSSKASSMSPSESV